MFVFVDKTTFFYDDYGSPFGELAQETSPCSKADTCHDCIGAGPDCGWCTAPDNYTQNRCDTLYNLQASGCPSPFVYSPTNQYEVEMDEELSNKTDEYSEPIQMRPQRVALRLRPKYPHKMRVDFKQARDYPVDLYYLMDLSKSMDDDKKKLAELGDFLARKMRNLTSNFRLGFGSFVDKTVMPYVSTVPEK